MKRRSLIKASLLTPLGISSGLVSCQDTKNKTTTSSVKHSACRWCYSDIPLELLCEKGKDLGLHSIELLNPDEWKVARDKGLDCAISNGSELGITKGFNDPTLHAQLLRDYELIIQKAVNAGIEKIFASREIEMACQINKA